MSKSENSNAQPQILAIIDGEEGANLFDKRYIIPRYQRAFAWGYEQIEQLIDDILKNEQDKYFLGSLIVNKKTNDESYEVIDGQQRLTALYLLLSYFKQKDIEGKLSYSSRDRANYTLSRLKAICGERESGNAENIDAENIDKDIADAFIYIKDMFESINKDEFRDKLKRVRLFFIEVPHGTDLNRYFEIMNTRGEQLDQTDIVKAKLLECVKDKSERRLIAVIWEACADMTGYVQMHFGTELRDKLFGEEWTSLPAEGLTASENKKVSSEEKKSKQEVKDEKIKSIENIILGEEPGFENKEDGETEAGRKVRFNSIIDFQYFLLHVLRAFINTKEMDFGSQNADELSPLDDIKLVKNFDSVIKSIEDKTKINGTAVEEAKREFACKFAEFMLICRFLFDKYIIKREFRSDSVADNDGEWSLKKLKQYSYDSKHTAGYEDTEFAARGQGDKEIASEEKLAKRILQLQSCYRVTYTSPRSMRWITDALEYLYNNSKKGNGTDNGICGCIIGEDFIERLEDFARKNLAEYLKPKDGKKDGPENKENDDYNPYCLGVATPHLMLNMLDYLLWVEDSEKEEHKYSDFTFEYRNTVEHWYPRNPRSIETWENVDRFGNLCLLQRGANSRLSNLTPFQKAEDVKKMNNPSIKLRLMSENIGQDDLEWRNKTCEEHENKMKEILENFIKEKAVTDDKRSNI